MAKQTGNMPVIGTMNNMTYFKSKDGIMVKMKSAISKDKFKTKNFEITFRNNLEFGLAGKAGKTLRYAIANVIGDCKDGRLASRLLTLMLKIAKTDTTSVHGERNVAKGQVEMLEGFDFNINSPLPLHFTAPYIAGADRVTGKLTLDIPAFNPANMLLVPDGATHFKMIATGSEVDFPNDNFVSQSFETALQPVGAAASTPVSAVLQVTANSTLPLFIFLGVQYFLEVNGAQTPIRSSDANSMGIVKLEA